MANKILIGSTYFFKEYEDFDSKDLDEIELIETNEFKYMRHLTGRGKCFFQMRIQDSIDTYIEQALQTKTGMVIGKFLVPEFCEAIGFTIQDLKRVEPLLEYLDDKHKYEEIIFNSYIENNEFVLTQEQRDKAYESYKQSRK